jgi:thymidylate synthase
MNNLDRQYKELLDYILHFGVEKQDRTGTGTKSIFGWQIRHDMREGFPLLTTKKMAWKSIVVELLWFLQGDTNIKYLLDNDCHIWDGDAYKNFLNEGGEVSKEDFIRLVKTEERWKSWGDLGPIYGKQWRQWQGWIDAPNEHPLAKGSVWHDQIGVLIHQLKTNPDSRRLMVSAWNVGELDQMVLPPCHYGFQIYTRELSHDERINLCLQLRPGTKFAAHYETNETLMNDWNIPTRAISLMWNQRSVDTFLGIPFNVASYGLLLEIIAKTVNMVPDQLIGNLGDVHLYNNHLEQAKEQCSRTPYDLPKLNINTEFWPTENGSCGEGSLDATAVFNSFQNDNFCKCLLEEDIQLYDYQSHPVIKAPLSN